MPRLVDVNGHQSVLEVLMEVLLLNTLRIKHLMKQSKKPSVRLPTDITTFLFGSMALLRAQPQAPIWPQ